MYLELKNVSKRFADAKAGEPDAVSRVDLGVAQGELMALLGPSGSGKTTLLRLIAGLDAPTEGRIYIDGNCVNDLSPSQRKVGFVFQHYALFRYMTVAENIAFDLDVQKQPKAKTARRVKELLSLIGMAGLGDRYPNQLSGGQRQRVAFARALATNPSLLLLDEPFAAVDAKVRKELRSWLRDMIREVGVTSIFVTHDQEEAVDVADRIAILREGRLEQSGIPYDIYMDPQTPFAASFMGDPIILEGLRGFRGFPDIRDDQRVMVRPENVETFRVDNPKFHDLISVSDEGTVEDVRFRGDSVELTIEVNGVKLVCRRSLERRPVQAGERMRVLLYRVIVFDGGQVRTVRNELLRNVRLEFM